MGPAGKENLAAEAPEAVRITVATGPEEKEARQAPEGSRAEVAVMPGPEEAVVEGKPEEGGTRQAPGGSPGKCMGSKERGSLGPGSLRGRSAQRARQRERNSTGDTTQWPYPA